MQVSWPTLACPSSSGSSFWSHEWEKHGTCSESILNQHGYFQAALNHKDKVDLLQILESAVSWPTLACPSSSGSSFWSHEWKKHGTCSESILNQHGYFQAALNHKDKVDLLQILESAGSEGGM
ncbi:extracellular ribonuclease le [Quercus suber]|uniref:Extracellular ribonuclease le n=1 Tax=Quercus suber TaxID=58331 RepID=A0AAW0L4W0_QUESU